MKFEQAKQKAAALADIAQEASAALSAASNSYSQDKFRKELESAEDDALAVLTGIRLIKSQHIT